jgi:hypothetical protein
MHFKADIISRFSLGIACSLASMDFAPKAVPSKAMPEGNPPN